MTRTEAKEVFDHVLNNVLDRGDSSPLKTSLIIEGTANIFDLLTITDDIIDGLVYEDPAEKNKFYSVTKGDKMLLRCFLAYQCYLESKMVILISTKLSHKVTLITFGSVQHTGP
jgi:hypothetical protein